MHRLLGRILGQKTVFCMDLVNIDLFILIVILKSRAATIELFVSQIVFR